MKKYLTIFSAFVMIFSFASAETGQMPEMTEEYLLAREAALNRPFETRNTVVVDQFGGGDYTTIQDAIDDTGDGTVIYVNAGHYYEYVYMSNSGISRELRGAGMGATVIKSLCNPMYISTGAGGSTTISGFTFETINNSCAGYLLQTHTYDSSTVTVEHCEFPEDGNEAPYEVYGNSSASTIIRNNIFKDNTDAIRVYGTSDFYCYNNVFDETSTAIIWHSGGYSVIEICNNMFYNSGAIALPSSSWQHWNRYNASTGNISYDYFPLNNIDPMFFDPSNGDYRISDDSPLIDTGAPDDIYVDLDGSRNNIGVYGGPYTWRSLGPIITNFQVTPDVLPQGETIRIQATGSAE